MFTTSLRRTGALALLSLFAASCTDAPEILSPLSPLTHESTTTSISGTLLQCPTSETQSTSGYIGTLGGVLSLGGFKVEFPEEAVLSTTKFTLTVPASQYMEIEVKAEGHDHYTFTKPVKVQIDYTRCDSATLPDSLTVFYVDSQTKDILEDKGGIDDRANKKIQFNTDHFSGYVVGSQ